MTGAANKIVEMMENKRTADQLAQRHLQEITALRRENAELRARLEENGRDVEILKGRRFILK